MSRRVGGPLAVVRFLDLERESAIVDLSGFGTKSAERRFMLAFLEALP